MRSLLVVSSWMPSPPDNGSRIRAMALLRALASEYAISLVSLEPAGSPDALHDLRRLCASVAVAPLERSTSPRHWLSRAPRHLASTRATDLDRLLVAGVHEHDAVLALQLTAAYRVLPLTRRVPTVFDELELGVPFEKYIRATSPQRRVRHGLTWFKLRAFARHVVRRFDRTTVVSDEERRIAIRAGCDPARLVVVPNGVDVDPGTPRPVKVRRLIYPGAVTFDANLDAVTYFVKAIYPRVRRACGDVELWVTGDTGDRDIRDLSSVEGVRFTGRLPDVAPAVAESAVCVVPLRIAGGTRLKVLQAMALGTVVVATSKGVEGLEVVPGRHVLVADAPEAFADSVIDVLRQPEMSTRIVNAARAHVADVYDWSRAGDRLLETLAHVIAARPTASPYGTNAV